MYSVQELIQRLGAFWAQHGCALHHGHDVEVGAGTFNPATFFRCLGPEPYRAAYVEPSRRPKDGRYGDNPNRTQLFHQFQVILKPSPFDIQQSYLRSLEAIGFRMQEHDIRFVHDDWEQPTLGAWGLGWEVWRDGMEVSQFTYFQAVGSIEVHPVTVEITYGIERLAMVVQKKDNFYDLQWNETLTYGDLYHRSEVEWSTYNFEAADVAMWRRHFDDYEAEAKRLLGEGLPLPGYDFVMKASHAFNMLDARGVISVSERMRYIQRIRGLSRLAAEGYLDSRAALGYPLLKRKWLPTAQASEEPVEVPPKTASLEGKADFVLEIGSEELPASFVPIGLTHLQKDLVHLLERESLGYENIEMLGTPRRLVAYVKGLVRGKPEKLVERRGPALKTAFDAKGEPTRAAEGFFRSLGVAIPSEREVRDGAVSGLEARVVNGNEYLFASVKTEAKSTWETLAAQLPKLILDLDFPKKMRWGDLKISYARPLHWIVALHGQQVIPFEVGPIRSGRRSSAHAQLCPGRFSIDAAGEFVSALRNHKILVNVEERKQSILDQLAKVEASCGYQALAVETVLPHVVHMTEWPMLTSSTFDASFLEVPRPVLVSEMVQHQKVFPLVDGEDRLANAFVIVADNTPTDAVRAGNTRVISARLADGRFLYAQDLKLSLEAMNKRLKEVIFRKELGSVYDKAQRVARDVEVLHSYLPLGSLEDARRAAVFCKADLASELVNEFPELQGTIGKLYALAKGEPSAVATAIDEHWMPRGEKTPLPASDAGILCSLADKIDNLLGCFALGLKPSSSSDPYALRRQVLGIVKILVNERQRLPIMEVLTTCYSGLCESTGLKTNQTVLEEIRDFFVNRIRTVFLDYGLARDTTEAALSGGFTDIYDSFCRVKALQDFRESDQRFPLLAEVYKRAAGQVEQGRREGTPPSSAVDTQRLEEEAERALFATLERTAELCAKRMQSADYDGAYVLLADLQQPLARLFDTVKILTDDRYLRQNRLALLQTVVVLFNQLLDFHKISLL